MRYSPELRYVQGRQQTTADALSRAPVECPTTGDTSFVEEVDAFADLTVQVLPASEVKRREISQAQKDDSVCSQVRQYCQDGWPAYLPHTPLIRPYFENRSHLTITNDLLLYDDRIVIPSKTRLGILHTVHDGHLGITKCRARARAAVWWPGLSREIEEMVMRCDICAKVRPEVKEKLMASSFPSRPWERLGMDLCDHRGVVYLVIVDYFSRWLEFRKLQNQTSEHTIAVLKEVFATHGIPDIVMSDNGPQFSSAHFSAFAATYVFTHTTSSPRYPQSNGESERAVRTLKQLLSKNDDAQLALLTYRTTPLQSGLSPSEMLMGRQLRTRLPTTDSKLQQGVPEHARQTVVIREDEQRNAQQQQFDLRHRAKDLPALQPGNNVWIRDMNRHGSVVKRSPQPRSYLVQMPKGIVRRNRAALVTMSDHHEDDIAEQPSVPSEHADVATTPRRPPSSPLAMRTRTGRLVRAPVRLDLRNR